MDIKMSNEMDNKTDKEINNKNNNKITIGIKLIICILIMGVIYYLSTKESFINYNTGKKSFMVLDKQNNYEYAAQILNDVDTNILLLIDYINKKYSNLDSIDNKNSKEKLLYIIKNKINATYRSDSLKENFPSVIGKDVSYNLNKGSDISLCLRNYDNPDEFHELNDIMFVAIHEVAHSCNESYGHDKKFWKIFRVLLENAIEIDIFKNINYRKDVVNYCSMHITYNPIFDKSLADKVYFSE